MSATNDELIAALRHKVKAQEELIEALTAAVDAWKGAAETRKGQVERLKAELLEEQAPPLVRRRADCPNCAPCPCAETD